MQSVGIWRVEGTDGRPLCYSGRQNKGSAPPQDRHGDRQTGMMVEEKTSCSHVLSSCVMSREKDERNNTEKHFESIYTY